MIKFSIIVPFYNGFDKINKLFDSLKKQTYKNFEVIIVDDMSSDDSYEKLSQFIEQLAMDIKLFRNKKNSGPGIARNTGIANCQGEYILFVDSDDYIHETTLEQIYELTIKNQYDLILFDSFFDKNGKLTLGNFNYGLMEGKNDIKKILVQVIGSTLGKCYKANIIKSNNIEFISTKRGEDSPFFREVVSFCETAYYLKQPLYYYVQYSESLMHQKDRGSIDDIEEAFKQIQKALKTKYPYELLQLSSREYIYTQVCTLLSSKESDKTVVQLIDECNEQYPGWYSASLKYKKKKYLSIILWCIYKSYLFPIKFLLKLRVLSIKMSR